MSLTSCKKSSNCFCVTYSALTCFTFSLQSLSFSSSTHGHHRFSPLCPVDDTKCTGADHLHVLQIIKLNDGPLDGGRVQLRDVDHGQLVRSHLLPQMFTVRDEDDDGYDEQNKETT